jgi:hypothetical protein
MKYAVMVPFGSNDYIYVTRLTGDKFEVEPVLHDTHEAAVEAAAILGQNSKIVPYEENNDEA